MPALSQAAHDLVGAVLGAGEDERAVDRLAACSSSASSAGLRGAVDMDDALLDALDRRGRRRHRDAGRDRAASGRRARRSPAAWWRRRTASAAPCGSMATILRMSWMKPMSSMRSASSSTRISTWSRRSALLLHEVEQAAGRGDQHVDAARQRADLLADRHAADGERDRERAGAGRRRGSCRRSGRTVRASGESTSTRQVFLLGPQALGGEAVEDRQREGRGLAGAGLRDADEVAACEDERNGLGLDRSGSDVFLFGEGAGDRLCEAEVVK